MEFHIGGYECGGEFRICSGTGTTATYRFGNVMDLAAYIGCERKGYKLQVPSRSFCRRR
jgi:hypothetical protein